ncbi:uncharacterized protein B0T15DRAFT_156297 [Chaetomium strumarium]|uniref:SAP domain-containing protein n=1 Tax=Chaetomium strumarium TaxID=1170767 RepID=A0AAJ0GVD8_9PEZI|nr:hypothetical protein B0T15DRAFT_156297 [Chaetomium strumarium]
MEADFRRMTVIELRQELKRRNLPQTGKKADLIDRLVAFEGEQSASEPHDDSVEERAEARQSPPVQNAPRPQSNGNSNLPLENQSVTEPQPSIDNHNPDTTPLAEGAVLAFTQTPAAEPTEVEQGGTETTAVVTEIVNDTLSRKRRSRSPPPDNELSRKRARPSDEVGEAATPDSHDHSQSPGDNHVDNATAEDPIGQESFVVQPVHSSQTATESKQTAVENNTTIQETAHYDQEEQYVAAQERDWRDSRETTPIHLQGRQGDIVDERMTDYDREVAPAQHPATSALYIKNFMRPLREPVLRDYLVDLAATPGAAPDPDCVVDFYLDQIRTHAFVQFTSVSAASRVRTALHGTVWPNERNRKELWVDFIPEDKVTEWADREQSEGGRGSSGRWEVHYEADDNGDITARLVNAEMEPVQRNSTRQPLGPPPVPTGPARNYPGVEGAPLGPRGRGTNHYRQAPPPPPPASSTSGRDYRITRSNPPLEYKPVSEEVAERRVANIQAHITKDRHRDLGRPDEINRYTFEDGDLFVDRGKEAFIGIRPPHRERERQRLGIGRGGRSAPPVAAPAPRRRSPSPRRPLRDDDVYRGSRDDYRDRDRDGYRDHHRDDVPRSRFDGQPLPTFAGGGGRGGRRGGGRRDRY